MANEFGKEVVLAQLGPGDFFGEQCLMAKPIQRKTAAAATRTIVLAIEKEEMIRVLHAEHVFFDLFMAYILSRKIRIEEDLADQLLNSSEKRLARTLLLLAHYGTADHPQEIRPQIPQEVLANMIGTSRGRVNALMNQFRRRGFVKYDKHYGALHINASLMDVFLHE